MQYAESSHTCCAPQLLVEYFIWHQKPCPNAWHVRRQLKTHTDKITFFLQIWHQKACLSWHIQRQSKTHTYGMSLFVQIFSADTLRELDASAYEEAPPLLPDEIAAEMGRNTGSAAHPGFSSRSLGSQRHSLGTLPSQLESNLPPPSCTSISVYQRACQPM